MKMLEQLRLRRLFLRKVGLLLLLWIAASGLSAQPVRPLPRGHAHNDYAHKQPLNAALEEGYTSLEIDVYRKRGKLRVSHWPFLLGTKPEFEALYLAPLRQRISENKGTVFPGDSTQLILMIDLKSKSASLYPLLRAQFREYEDLIETYTAGKRKWGPLKLVLTGGPPLDSLQVHQVRYFSADAALADWDSELDEQVMPRASCNYKTQFKWKGRGEMPQKEWERLVNLVALAHKHRRKIRFWGAPDHPAVWKVLLDAGVDWINVDDLEGFRKFWWEYLR